MSEPTQPHTNRRSDTRERIQRTALEMFADQGYEKTSLRAIAEHLDVTKAALYYHFKTKEDIVDSVFADLLSAVDEIVEWAEAQELGAKSRAETLRRYAALVTDQLPTVVRFVQENQGSMRELSIGTAIRDRLARLVDVLVAPEAPVTEQLRGRIALLALNAAVGMDGIDATVAERVAAALQIALELTGGRPGMPAPKSVG